MDYKLKITVNEKYPLWFEFTNTDDLTKFLELYYKSRKDILDVFIYTIGF